MSSNPSPGPAPSEPAFGSPGPKFPTYLLIAGILVLTAAAYAPVVSAPFVLDDFANIVDNPWLPRVGSALPRFFSTLGMQPNPSRPLAYLSFALNFILFGPGPTSFHLVNIAIHLLAASTLYALLHILLHSFGARLTPAAQPSLKIFALALTALWALHPVQTEAVSYAVQRMTSLAGLFYLLALLAYVHARTTPRRGRRVTALVGLVLAGIGAGLTKETSLTLPVFLLALEYFFFYQPRQPGGRAWPLGLIGLIAVFAAAGALGLGPRAYLSITHGYALRNFTLAERLLTETRVIFYYLFLSWIPAPSLQRLLYAFPLSHGLFNPVSTGAAVLLLAGGVWALAPGLVRRRLRALLMLWFLGQLALESSVVPLELAYEHRLYLPVLAPLAGLAYLALVPGRSQRARVCLLLGLILLFGADTYLRNRTWSDPLRLWRDSVAKSPDEPRAWANLGKIYRNRKELGPALWAYQQAERVDPKNTDVLLNLSGLYSQLNLDDRALEAAERAVALKPQNPQVLLAMGEAASEAGQAQAALTWFLRAREISPADPQVLEKLGNQYLDLDQPEPARALFEKIRELDPDWPGAFLLLGNSYFSQGRFREAEAAYQEELRRRPDSAEALNNLGMAWLRQGRPGEAAGAFQAAANLAPEMGLYQGNLCEAEADLGRLDAAIVACRQAVAREPSLTFAWKKLGTLYLRQGRWPEARAALEQAQKLFREDSEVNTLLESRGERDWKAGPPASTTLKNGAIMENR